MDSSIDIVKMRNATVMAAQGRAIAQGIVAYGNLRLKATAPAPTPAPKPIVNPVGELFRVRKSWSDVDSQLGAFSDLNGAIDIAKTKAGYNVYDSKGKQVYPAKVVAPEQPKTDNLYRVRKLWSDVGSQLGAFADLEGAIVLADKNITYNVYDGKGDLAYDPRKAKAEREKAEADAKAKAEADAAMTKLVAVVKAADIPVLDVAIVINSGGDYASAKLVHDATGIPIYERSGVGNRRVAKHVIGIGGLAEGIAMNGDTVTMLSGKSRFDTEEAVKAFVARVR